jgi:predicted dehydrogenase
MPNPFRIAFLGIDHPHGAGWRESLANLAGEMDISAILPAYSGALTSLEERFAQVPRFHSLEDLLSRGDFEAAVVCLPNDTGPEAVVRLASAGKHILCEKPTAACAADARRMAEALEQAGVAYQNGYMWRYDPLADRLQAMIAEGRFGRLTSIEMKYMTSDIRRRGPDHYLFDAAISTGGFFNWLACHHLDLLLYITGQSIVGVTARVGVFGGTAVSVEDGGTAIMELSGGGLATFTGGYWLPRWAGEIDWNLRGTERWVHWEPGRAGTGGAIEIHGPKPQWHAMEETFALPVDSTPGYGGERNVALIRDWVAAARAGGRPCRNTPQSAIQTLQLIDAIYESSRTGQRIACHIGD